MKIKRNWTAGVQFTAAHYSCVKNKLFTLNTQKPQTPDLIANKVYFKSEIVCDNV